VNANFPQNIQRTRLPMIQGVIVLCDAKNGYPLAVMDSIEITIQRTGAATAVAAKYLARADSRTATICGCGNQGRVSLRALKSVLPIERVWVYDCDEEQAQRLASDLGQELRIDINITNDLRAAVRQSDICVTCTPARQPFLKNNFVAQG